MRRRNACLTASISATCPTVNSGTFSSSKGSMAHLLPTTRTDVWPAGPAIGGSAGHRSGMLVSLAGQLLAGANLDLAGLGLLANRDADLENTVVVARLDAVCVEVLREPDATGEAAEQPLPDDRGLALGLGLLARGAHGEHAAVDGDVNLLRVKAGDVEPEHQLAVAPDGVHRQSRGGGRAEAGAERTPDDAVEVPRDRVESSQVHRCLLGGSCHRWRLRPLSVRNLQLKLYVS